MSKIYGRLLRSEVHLVELCHIALRFMAWIWPGWVCFDPDLDHLRSRLYPARSWPCGRSWRIGIQSSIGSQWRLLRRKEARGLGWPGRMGVVVEQDEVLEQGVGLEGHSILPNMLLFTLWISFFSSYKIVCRGALHWARFFYAIFLASTSYWRKWNL